ncbi:MAG: translational machinery protein [Xanthobacteraceae bacterium]|jgi:stalled ribosome rescue protein Dom34
MSHFHAVVWVDHSQAKIFHVGSSGTDGVILHPHSAEKHIHHKANSIGSGHAHEGKQFMESVTEAITDAGEILIVGPAGAKNELAKYLRTSHPAIGQRIVGVEPADHLSDREIVALARQHFKLGAPRSVSSPGAAH